MGIKPFYNLAGPTVIGAQNVPKSDTKSFNSLLNHAKAETLPIHGIRNSDAGVHQAYDWEAGKMLSPAPLSDSITDRKLHYFQAT